MNDEKMKKLKEFLNDFGWDMGLFDVDDTGQIMSMVIGETAYIGQLVEEFTNEEVIEKSTKGDPTLH